MALLLLVSFLATSLTACGTLPYQPVPLMGEGPPPGYISGDIPRQYSGMRNPYSLGDTAALTAGAHVYVALRYSCASCHGVDGRGDGPMAAYLDWGPADFSAPPMLAAFRDHQDYVFWWVSAGVAKTQMPSHSDLLSQQEMWQVITYAWSLGEKGAARAAGDRPQRATVPWYRR